MPVFDYAFEVDAPLDAVRAFHHDTRALKLLTPPPTVVRLHAVEPLGEGSVSRFTLWIGPLPVRWTAVHRDVTERGFTDVQVEGPAARWEHTHAFTPLGPERTRISEHVEYAHRPGPRGLLTRVLFARPGLRLTFAYRRWITRRLLGRRRSRG